MESLSSRLGFSKRSNLNYFLTLTTPMVILVLWRWQSVFVIRKFCSSSSFLAAAPGECYWYTQPWSRYQIGLYLHLWSVFPGSLVAILQFIPAIRSRHPKVHRLVGYACWFLGVTAAASALMIFDHAFGGTISTKVACISLAGIAFVGHYQAYQAIKGYRLDEHRLWMLRTWVNMGSIVTMRFLLFPFALAISLLRKYSVPGEEYYGTIDLWCGNVFRMLNEHWNSVDGTQRVDFFSTYGASCTPNLTAMHSPSTILRASKMSPAGGFESLVPHNKTILVADLTSERIDHTAAALDIAFGPAILVALIIHVILLEWYFRSPSNKEEVQRLRKLGNFKRRAREEKLERENLAAVIEKSSAKANGHMKEAKADTAKGLRVEVREIQREDELISAQALSGERPLNGHAS